MTAFLPISEAARSWSCSEHISTGTLLVNKPKTTATVIIARWPRVSHTVFITILRRAEDTSSSSVGNDLLRCDRIVVA